MLEQARALDERDPGPYLALLDIYRHQGLRQVTSEMLDEVRSFYAATPLLRLELARIEYENGRAEQAGKEARDLVQEFPHNNMTVDLFARIERFLGKPQPGLDALEEFYTMAPALERVQALRLMAKFRPSGLNETLCLQKALVLSPQSPSLQLSLGMALREAGHTDQALAIFRSLEKTELHSRAALEAGHILIEQGRRDEALRLALAAQKAQPQSPWGYKLEADVSVARGNARAAFEAMGKLARSETPNAYIDLAGARVLNAIGLYEKAADSARHGLAQHDPAALLPLLKEQAEAMLNGDLNAGDAFEQLRVAGFEDPEALVLLARRAIHQGKMSDAAAALSQALRMAPLHAQALATAAQYALTNGDVISADFFARAALAEMTSIDPYVCQTCAGVFARTNQGQAVRIALELLLRVKGLALSAPARKI